MPLAKTCSAKAMSKNVAREIRAGKSRAQAVAIGYATLKKACGVKSAKRMTPKQIVGKKRHGVHGVPGTENYIAWDSFSVYKEACKKPTAEKITKAKARILQLRDDLYAHCGRAVKASDDDSCGIAMDALQGSWREVALCERKIGKKKVSKVRKATQKRRGMGGVKLVCRKTKRGMVCTVKKSRKRSKR